jgi:hypothetical protein
MYRIFLAIALMLALSPATAAGNKSEPTVVAFIGTLISIKELPDQCPHVHTPIKPTRTGPVCIQLDSLYEARYEITEVLGGSIHSKEITFKIADHYGFPHFTEYQHALLFVDISPTENWLEKYRGYPVYRTSDNAWASCGNPYDELDGKAPRHLRPITFANDFGIVGQFSREGIANRFFDSKYMVVEGDKISCHSGVYAADLYEMVRSDVVSARGIQLPALGDQRSDPTTP